MTGWGAAKLQRVTLVRSVSERWTKDLTIGEHAADFGLAVQQQRVWPGIKSLKATDAFKRQTKTGGVRG